MSITKYSSVFKVDEDVDKHILKIEQEFEEWIELTEVKTAKGGDIIESQILNLEHQFEEWAELRQTTISRLRDFADYVGKYQC